MQAPSFSSFITKQSFECGTPRFGKPLFYTLFLIFNVVGKGTWLRVQEKEEKIHSMILSSSVPFDVLMLLYY